MLVVCLGAGDRCMTYRWRRGIAMRGRRRRRSTSRRRRRRAASIAISAPSVEAWWWCRSSTVPGNAVRVHARRCGRGSIVVAIASIAIGRSRRCSWSSRGSPGSRIVSTSIVGRSPSTSASTSPRGRSIRGAVIVATVITGPGSSTSGGTAFPWLDTSLLFASAVAVCGSVVVVDSLARSATLQFVHEGIQLILGSRNSASIARATVVIAPVLSASPVGTVTSHMSSLATDTTNDAGSVVLFLRAVVLAMSDLAAVLAGLVLIVSEGTVERGKLTELVALQLVLAFGDGSSLNLISHVQLETSEILTVSMTL